MTYFISHVHHISPHPMFHQQSVFNKQVQVSNRLFHTASSQAGTLLQILFEQTETLFHRKNRCGRFGFWTLTADSALTASSNPVPYKTTYSHGNSSLEVSLKRHEVLERGHSILQQTATNTGKEVAMVQKFFLLNSPLRNEKATKGLLITYLTNISFFSERS